MTVPEWLFDELVNHITDRRELVARMEAWAGLLDEIEPVPEPTDTYSRLDDEAVYELTLAQAEFLHSYEALRSTGAQELTFGAAQRSGFWGTSDITVEADGTYYLKPKRAAELAGVSTQKLLTLRRRGELRSIGLTPSEYRRAREAAGWGDAQGWGSEVFLLREDISSEDAQEHSSARRPRPRPGSTTGGQS